MKNLLFISIFALVLFGCKKDEPKPEITQDYTSFIIWHNEPVNLINSVAGYYDKDGYCWKIADLGDLTQGKYSPEIIVANDTLRYIYLFSDYPSKSTKGDTVFVLKKNIKNIFEITATTKGVYVNQNDPTQYPQ